tara:strand:- start:298 stop:531 length:234 start_codon:yes stop_codon:yes gene_type:complete
MSVPKSYELKVNLNDAIEDFNPDLTEEQIEMIARDICMKWSYTQMYDEIEHKALEFMKLADFGYETEHEAIDHEMYR